MGVAGEVGQDWELTGNKLGGESLLAEEEAAPGVARTGGGGDVMGVVAVEGG
jgi:hypothetical protein